MAGDITFEHISTQNRFDLEHMFQNDPFSEEASDLLFYGGERVYCSMVGGITVLWWGGG